MVHSELRQRSVMSSANSRVGHTAWPLARAAAAGLLSLAAACGGPVDSLEVTITPDGTFLGQALQEPFEATARIAVTIMKNPTLDVTITKTAGGSNRALSTLLGRLHLPETHTGTAQLTVASDGTGAQLRLPIESAWLFIDDDGTLLVSTGGVPLAPIPNLAEVNGFATVVVERDPAVTFIVATDGDQDLEAGIQAIRAAGATSIYRLTEEIEVVSKSGNLDPRGSSSS